MMRALDPQVHDPVFEAIQGLLPEPKAHPLGCHRPRVSDRLCFRGLLIRMITGAAWETIEDILERRVSDTTLRARRDEWINAGVFDRLVAQAQAAYDRIIGFDTEHVTIDGSDHLAPCGGEGTAPGPKTYGRQGWKWCVGVDTNGIPLGWVIDGANRNDYKLLQPTLDQINKTVATRSIGTLHLDRGFGYPSLNDRLDGYNIKNVDVIPRKLPGKGRIELVGFGRRWVGERTHSWFTNYRQLANNTDRKNIHRHAALCLATTFLITSRLVDHNNTHNPPNR